MKKILFYFLFPLYAVPAGALPVVPGGEGFGMTTRAAYGGSISPTIYRVTNLNDSGSGSLRAALEAAEPRVVLFEISGYVMLNSQILIRNPYLTVAGQTAPYPGITLRRYGILIMTHDVLFQHLRVRVGDEGAAAAVNAGWDGLFAYTENAYNIVVDHCSISWAEGESAGTVSPPATSNITYSNNIISEGLHFSAKVPENSHGMVIYPGTRNFAAIGNLFAHNVERNPEMQEGSQTLLVNNVIYDWGQTDDINYYPSATFFYQSGRLGNVPFLSSIVGNKYIKGPTMPAGKYAIYTYSGTTGSQLYLNDNAVEGVTLYGNNMGFDPRVGSPPVSLSGISVRPSSSIEAYVLAHAGARPIERDAVDQRIVAEVTNRTGTWIASQSQVGGYPPLAQNARSLIAPANPHTVQSSGYTALEVWLQGFAGVVEGTISIPPLNPSPDGTEIPPASQIVDTTGVIWTFANGTSGDILRNGVHAAPGWGTDLLWLGGKIYTLASDSHWWVWNGTDWDFYSATKPGTASSACDLNQDGSTTVPDVQLAINQLMGLPACLPAGQPGSADINHDGRCDVVDVQRVVNAALGVACIGP